MSYISLTLNEAVAYLGGVASILLISAIATAWANYAAYKQRKELIVLLKTSLHNHQKVNE